MLHLEGHPDDFPEGDRGTLRSVYDLVKFAEDNFLEDDWLFRGQTNESWELLPSIDRDPLRSTYRNRGLTRENMEVEFLRRFKRDARLTCPLHLASTESEISGLNAQLPRG